jgi:uncharacterized RDD family membrane protein YckC
MTSPAQRQVDTRVVVETPEGVDFRFVIAGPGTRAYAWLIDSLLKYSIIVVVVLISLAYNALSAVGGGMALGLVLVLLFLMNWFYGSLFETLWNGQTPGKKSAGLRVVRTNGTPIDTLSAVGRNFLRAADTLPVFYLSALISMLVTRRMQRIGDVVFDTMVIDERREWISRAQGITDRVEPLLRADCRGRFNVPDRTLSVIERLFEQDRRISDARREEIARPLSEALRARLGWEEPPPDPRNPHTYFQQQSNRHTRFLMQVLKTFQEGTGVERSAAVTGNAASELSAQRVRSVSEGAVP